MNVNRIVRRANTLSPSLLTKKLGADSPTSKTVAVGKMLASTLPTSNLIGASPNERPSISSSVHPASTSAFTAGLVMSGLIVPRIAFSLMSV